MGKDTLTKMNVTSTKAAKGLVKEAVERGLTLYMEGKSGIGKSEIVRQVANDMGKDLIDIRAILYDLGDIVVKIPNNEKTKLIEIVTDVLPTKPGSIIFLDEFRHAPQEVRRMFYQLILDKRIGSSYSLPENTTVIACSNLTEEVDTQDLEGPLFDRWDMRVQVEAEFKEWEDYVFEFENSQIVIGYLNVFKEDWYQVNPETNIPLTTPRRWTKLMAVLDNDTVVDAMLPPGISVKFREFKKKVEMFSALNEYLEGKKPFPKDISDQIALVTAVANKLASDKDYNKLADKVFEMKYQGATAEVGALLTFSCLRVLKKRTGATSLHHLMVKMKNADKLAAVLKNYQYLGKE